MNVITITDMHELWIKALDDKLITVRYSLVTRAGATTEMVQDTLSHFRFACAVCAADIDWDSRHKSMEKYSECREHEYNHMFPPHDEPSVQIFTNEFPVWHDGGIIRLSLNIFTELTSARLAVTFVKWRLSLHEEIVKDDEQLKPERVVLPPSPVKQQNELDKYFPRDENGKPAPQSRPATPPDNNGETPYFGVYGKEVKERLIADYHGKVVRLDVLSVVTNNINGQISWELFAKQTDQYPMAKCDEHFVRDGITLEYLKRLPVGQNTPLNTTGVFYCNVKPTRSGGMTVYLNLNKLDCAHGEVVSDPHEVSSFSSDDDYRGEDIPF